MLIKREHISLTLVTTPEHGTVANVFCNFEDRVKSNEDFKNLHSTSLHFREYITTMIETLAYYENMYFVSSNFESAAIIAKFIIAQAYNATMKLNIKK